MLQGEPYFSSDKTLVELRKQTKHLCQVFNQSDLRYNNDRLKLQKQILLNAKGVWIEPNFYCDYGVNIYSQHSVFINHNVCILDGAKITLGDHVLIGPNCVLASTSHPVDIDARQKGLSISKPITLEDNVWLGANVTILGGVTIGRGTIIGAGQVVTKDIGPGQIVR